MRLADFILANIEPILTEWEAFARSVWPDNKTGPVALRDHAMEMLRATALDMKSSQTSLQQADKSKGEGTACTSSDRVDGASDLHAVGRVDSGFDLMMLVAEYRALRASVVRLWRESKPAADLHDLEDVTRFNESVDQSLTEAIRSYTERVDRSRQMFLAILGHDLRNPLNSVMMSADVLSLSSELDAEQSAMVSQVSASASAMGQMIGDLLDFTGVGPGSAMPLSPAKMDLEAVCREGVEELRVVHPDRVVEFQSSGNLVGEWDAARLRQVVSNLVGNALQHGAENSPVRVEVSDEGSDIRLAVRNWGEPIPKNSIPTIFDPLVRGSTPAAQKKRRAGSIGLGLYIVREVVKAHGGTIDVQSSREQGTAFTARLPRHPRIRK